MENPYPRPLTTAEQDVLDRMLSVEFAGVETVQQSAEGAVVVGGCGCGCPTIYFRRDEPAEGMVLVSEGLLAQDQEQAVLLFANDKGDVAALELVWMTPTPPMHFHRGRPASHPEVDQLYRSAPAWAVAANERRLQHAGGWRAYGHHDRVRRVQWCAMTRPVGWWQRFSGWSMEKDRKARKEDWVPEGLEHVEESLRAACARGVNRLAGRRDATEWQPWTVRWRQTSQDRLQRLGADLCIASPPPRA